MAENSVHFEQEVNDSPAPMSPETEDQAGEEAESEAAAEGQGGAGGDGESLNDSEPAAPPPPPAAADSAAAPAEDKELKPEDQMRLYVWAGDDLRGLGDDVHCQQIYMILTLKSDVNKMAKFQVVTENIHIKKSQEFDKLAVNKLPCLVDPVGDRVISDVQTIVDYLEQVFKEPCLIPNKKSLQQVGVDLYRKFTGYLKNTNPHKEEEMKNALNRELEKLNRALVESSGKFLDGDHLTQPDLRLLPRLHHVVVAGKIFKGFEIPEDEAKFGRLKQYLDDWHQEDVYQETKYADRDLEFGWYKTRGLDRMYIKSKGGYRLK